MRAEPTLAEILADKLDSDRSRREFFKILAGAGLAVPLSARASWAQSKDAASGPLATKRKFMDSFYTLNNDYFNAVDQGATLAAEHLNITQSREINNGDVNVQKGHVENAPNLGIDGITMVAASEGSEIDLLRLANRLKIPVVDNHTKAAWNTLLDSGPYYVAFHAPPNVTATRARSAQVFQKLGGKGNVVHTKAFSATPSRPNVDADSTSPCKIIPA
jgi:ribose transport system substrate-binding protein